MCAPLRRADARAGWRRRVGTLKGFTGLRTRNRSLGSLFLLLFSVSLPRSLSVSFSVSFHHECYTAGETNCEHAFTERPWLEFSVVHVGEKAWPFFLAFFLYLFREVHDLCMCVRMWGEANERVNFHGLYATSIQFYMCGGLLRAFLCFIHTRYIFFPLSLTSFYMLWLMGFLFLIFTNII